MVQSIIEKFGIVVGVTTPVFKPRSYFKDDTFLVANVYVIDTIDENPYVVAQIGKPDEVDKQPIRKYKLYSNDKYECYTFNKNKKQFSMPYYYLEYLAEELKGVIQ